MDTPPTTRDKVADYMREAGVCAFAASHTGLPFVQDFVVDGETCAVVNNGAAGMPNFHGTTFGVLTRISCDPHPPAESLYAIELRGIRIDALPIRYDHDAWLRRFTTNWPSGSPAHASYFERMSEGPDYDLRQAVRLGLATHE
jgi:hypothetical protein